MCHKCSTPWSDGNFALSVIPAVHRDRKAKKLVDLLVAGKYLKKIQKSLAIKFKEDVNNRAVSVDFYFVGYCNGNIRFHSEGIPNHSTRSKT